MKNPDGIKICYSREAMLSLFDVEVLETIPQPLFDFLTMLQMSCAAIEETPEERAERVDNFLKYIESRIPDDDQKRFDRFSSYLEELLNEDFDS